MPDVWATVADLDSTTQERLADVLETRGADLTQQEMRRTFLGDVEFPPGAHVLEVGCGTGVLTRLLAGIPNVRFQEADARSLPFADASFDVAVFDSTLSHMPELGRALAEAFRVLRPHGSLAAFDGDYATATVALDDHDPLQACVDAMMANSVNDRRVMRRLPTLLRQCGFQLARTRSHGFVDAHAQVEVVHGHDRVAVALGQRPRLDHEISVAVHCAPRG